MLLFQVESINVTAFYNKASLPEYQLNKLQRVQNVC